ncbi:MAG: hypothetical protein PHH09_09340 [Methanoregulaceae archaeon]|jgi:hypothetical protein|nr:hypothetical protein [Methanoregulaceae archaeon]
MLGGGQHVTISDIVKFCREDDNGIDYAVPQHWLDSVRELGIKTKFVYSYREEDGQQTFGQPVSIGDMLLHEVAEGKAVVLKTKEWDSLMTRLRDLEHLAGLVNKRIPRRWED